MPPRRPLVTTESIAEVLRAALAFISVVLLARSQIGSFERTPAVWVVWVVSTLMWSAAVWATRWGRPIEGSLLGHWRNCVAPALITLMIGGANASAVRWELAVIVLGVAGVSVVAVDSARKRAFAEPKMTVAEAALAPLTSPQPAQVEPVKSEAEQRLDAHSAPVSEPSSVASLDHPLPSELLLGETPATESWTRIDSDGDVSIEAVVLARFAEGAKLAVVHLPFLPPLPEVPQIECEPLDSGCEVTIVIEAAYRHGARLSVTRRSAGHAESVPIGVVIYTTVEEEIES